MRHRRLKIDWFMFLIVIPVALLAAFVIYVGAKDAEEREQQYNVDSIRQVHKDLRTLEDSVRYFEDGF